jgi:nucleotide-binding universal stress UspA family protein
MRVLIAIDSSDGSTLALSAVAERLWPADAEFRVITVMEPAYLQPPFAGAYVEPMLNLQVEFENSCHELISEQIKRLKETFPDHAVTGETLLGPVASMILDEAKGWNADLIIVGSHGRTGINRFFLGSVADRVASHAQCSVEIVKQKLYATKLQTNVREEAVVGGKV